MKVFVLLSRVPYPLEKGDKLRAFHQVRLLAKHHEVYLCCLSDGKKDPESLAYLRTLVQHVEVIRLSRFRIGLRMIRAMFSDRPFQLHYFYQSKAARKVRASISAFAPDHIYCQLIRCTEYIKHLHEYRKTVDYMDALNAGLRRRAEIAPWYLRWFLLEEARRLVAYENLIFEYFDHHTIISQQDQQLIYHPDRAQIRVIPNGVDSDYFHPEQATQDIDLVFTGNMSYPPNVDCARRLALEILPLIHSHRPETRLLIAGANPVAEITELANSHVEVSGWMEDIRKAYSRSKVFIAPMRIGSGMQNKLLEAMSMEMPCITTPLAANALPAGVRNFLRVSDDNAEIARMTLLLLDQPDQHKELGKAGREMVCRQFNWAQSVHELENLFLTTKPTV